MSTRFAGRVVLVAGGTGALGSAVTQQFLDEGATVVATQRSAHGEATRFAVDDATRLRIETVDVTEEAAVGALVSAIVARHGRLDALVDTVGGWAGGRLLWQADLGELDRMLAVNLRSAFVLLRAVVPPMLAQRRGAIVGVAARSALDAPAGAGAYAAAKAAMMALMQSLAADLAGSGVRVNAVLPKVIDTAANRQAMPGAGAGWTAPQDIARTIAFLCSDDAAAVNGAAVPV